MSQSEFDRLEQFVGKLLQKHDQLSRENTRLENLLQEKDEKIESLEEQISSADSERGDISRRVKGLIEQIEEWESALQDSAPAESDSSEENVEEAVDAEVETAGEERDTENESGREIAERREEDKQQNLFNVGPRMNTLGS